jgi:heparan-alpha-glucosaminide N-acetyltransferase
MSTVGEVQPVTSLAAAVRPRVVSIDIFRGLTITVMIFVNAIAEVRGLPWWTYHAHANQDVMTYVDMVFPFFLFIVGMSMPLSVEQRLKRNPSLIALWMHVAVRSCSLLVLGLILANAEKADASRMEMNGSVWALFGLLSAGLYLNAYPKSQRFPRYADALRVIGLIGVAGSFLIFRRTFPDGRLAWIDPSYPEILGLIGFAYFAVAVLYIPTRRWRWAAPVWLILLVALCIGSAAKIIAFPDHLSLYVWPFGNGAHVSLVMAGVLTSQIFFGIDPGGADRHSAKNATTWAVAFALLALAAGWLSAPLGISKIRATPAWTLWNIGAAVLVFTLLHWICDRQRFTAWATLFRPGGSNTLLTYLLPDLWAFAFGALGVTYLDWHFNFGWEGVVKSIVFTLVMLAVSWTLTRARLRLQL